MDLVETVGTDPALAAKMVQVANSAAYGRPGRATSVADAVSILGLNMCRATAVAVFLNGIPSEIPQAAQLRLQERSLLTAVAAKCIAARRRADEQTSYLAGLLAYTGELLSAATDPIRMTHLMTCRDWDSPTIQQQVFGYRAADIGVDALREWGIPETICAAIQGRDGRTESRSPLAATLSEAIDLARNIANGTVNADVEIKVTADLLRGIWSALRADQDHPVDTQRVVAMTRAAIVLNALVLEDRLHGSTEEHVDPVTGLPDSETARRFARAIAQISGAKSAGVILFSVDERSDPVIAKQALVEALDGKVREHELLAAFDTQTLVLVTTATSEDELIQAVRRFQGFASHVDTDDGRIDVDISWALDQL